MSPLPCPSLGLQTMMPNQQQATYQGMIGVQQPQNQGLLNNQRNSLGGQMQGLVVQYSPLPSYQVGAFCIGKDLQSLGWEKHNNPVWQLKHSNIVQFPLQCLAFFFPKRKHKEPKNSSFKMFNQVRMWLGSRVLALHVWDPIQSVFCTTKGKKMFSLYTVRQMSICSEK